ncbi:MAG: helix-turn-helix domain-containing protein [Candidatus Methylacidiphilales bacterium]|nr:helix-turn-helix domain-containing protein [Candidatus Methylacidiphilales bacterium]
MSSSAPKHIASPLHYLDIPAKKQHNPAMARVANLKSSSVRLPATLLDSRFFPNERARVVIHREVHQPPISLHRHNFFEIATVMSGSGVHVTDGFRHRLQAGDVLLIDSSRAHGFEKTVYLNLINVLIRNDVLHRLGQEMKDLPGFEPLFSLGTEHRRTGEREKTYPNRLHLNVAEMEQMEDLATRIEEETKRGAQGGFLLAEAYLTLMLGMLMRSYERSRHATHIRVEGRFARVLQWIESHLANPLMVSDMARHAGMSERTFHRRFRETLGISPLDYVLQARIRRAREQLVKEGSRIAEVAQSCGFEDSNYFTRCFRQKTGQSPREYRKSAVGNV